MTIQWDEIVYLPGVVDVSDINANGKLLSDEVIAQLKKYIKDDGRHRYIDINNVRHKLKYAVVKQNKNYYAIYVGKNKIGSGGFAKVKLAQDLDTAEWAAVKIQSLTKSFDNGNSIAKKELETVIKAGCAINQTSSRKPVVIERFSDSKQRMQHYMFLKYAKGIELFDFYVARISMPAVMRIDLAVRVLTEIKKLHDKNMLHRDIKLENFRYDYSTGEVVLVDFGLAVEMDKNKEYVDIHRLGSRLFTPPEIISSQSSISYNEKTEMYSTGIVLGILFGFIGEIKNKLHFFSPNDPWAVNHKMIDDVENRENIHKLITRVMSVDPKERPTFAETILLMMQMKKKLKNEYKVMKIGVLDVKEYERHEHQSILEESFIANLRQYDQLWLVDEQQNSDSLYYARIKHNMEGHLLAVSNQIITGAPLPVLAKKIPAYVSFTINPDYIPQFFNVTTGERLKSRMRDTNREPLLGQIKNGLHKMGLFKAPTRQVIHNKSAPQLDSNHLKGSHNLQESPAIRSNRGFA